MFDLGFYMKEKKLTTKNIDTFESIRNLQPTIYNIETTNACNMRCIMCPRTTKMTRPIKTISKELFIKIIDQIKPHSKELWEKWEKFVQETYNIYPNDMSENHFFLYIIPKVIQLHAYGDPLLDKNMPLYVELLSKKGFQSYFSCNPANIDIKKTTDTFKSGLDYIKYSIESTDDKTHKKIRGNASNFTSSYNKICDLLELKEKHNYKTTIIITMLDLNRNNQQEEYQRLREAFKDLDVYIYLKSEDQQWYRKDKHGTKSIHWSESCKHPWMSMTIKSNGEAVMCMEDYNNEIILGDANYENLYNIWNGKKYKQFRLDHFNITKGIKCTKECDMKLFGDFKIP